MKTKLIFCLSFFLSVCTSFNLKAQSESDKNNYWILEDFNQLAIQSDWVIDTTNYSTYPYNNVNLTTVYANVEAGSDCAYGQHALRVRGAEEKGSVFFTVPNVSKATFYFTGKQKASDRGVRIYRDGTLIKEIKEIDRYDCMEFSEKIDSNTPVTYKITGAYDDKKDPFVLYYIEVQKYGVNITKPEPPQPNYPAYWIYEDFKHFPVEIDGFGDGVYNTTKNYLSLPNNIVLKTDSANIELGEGCSGGNERKVLRVRGKYYTGGGKVEFTVPDAKTVAINVTGKSTNFDSVIKIYINDVLVKTFEKLDRDSCVEYYEEPNSNGPITYRIEGGTNTEKPIAIKSIFVEKYGYTDINDIKKTKYEIYPNPASDIIYFKSDEPVGKVDILDANGRTILSQKNAVQLNISSLNKGFYIVRLSNKEGISSHKLIKN
jgi:hypothetical protein